MAPADGTGAGTVPETWLTNGVRLGFGRTMRSNTAPGVPPAMVMLSPQVMIVPWVKSTWYQALDPSLAVVPLAPVVWLQVILPSESGVFDVLFGLPIRGVGLAATVRLNGPDTFVPDGTLS